MSAPARTVLSSTTALGAARTRLTGSGCSSGPGHSSSALGGGRESRDVVSAAHHMVRDGVTRRPRVVGELCDRVSNGGVGVLVAVSSRGPEIPRRACHASPKIAAGTWREGERQHGSDNPASDQSRREPGTGRRSRARVACCIIQHLCRVARRCTTRCSQLDSRGAAFSRGARSRADGEGRTHPANVTQGFTMFVPGCLRRQEGASCGPCSGRVVEIAGRARLRGFFITSTSRYLPHRSWRPGE